MLFLTSLCAYIYNVESCIFFSKEPVLYGYPFYCPFLTVVIIGKLFSGISLSGIRNILSFLTHKSEHSVLFFFSFAILCLLLNGILYLTPAMYTALFIPFQKPRGSAGTLPGD